MILSLLGRVTKRSFLSASSLAITTPRSSTSSNLACCLISRSITTNPNDGGTGRGGTGGGISGAADQRTHNDDADVQILRLQQQVEKLQHQLLQQEALRSSELNLAVNNDGESLLHVASAGGCEDCVKWVLDNTCIDVNCVDSAGWTPLMTALNNDRFEVSKILFENGASLNQRNYDGERAIDINYNLGLQVLNSAPSIK
jgi:hypothetical protein